MRIPNTSKFNLLGIFTILAVACSSAHGGLFTTIDISSVTNANLQLTNSAFPAGLVTLGGVPFAIGSSGNNFYYSNPSGLSGTTTVSIPINLSDVIGVHMLINTVWGENVAGTFASLTFNFSDSTSFVKTLDGNVDVRDFYDNVFTNSINGTTTQNVFLTDNDGRPFFTGLHRLDKQFIDLSAFSSKTLVSMTLIDNGAPGFQRTFLSGVTAESITAVPEPSSFAMAAIALVGLLVGGRRSAKMFLVPPTTKV